MSTVTIKITLEHGKVKAKLFPEKHADERLVLAGLRAICAAKEPDKPGQGLTGNTGTPGSSENARDETH